MPRGEAILAGRFRLGPRLGRGTWSDVWSAEDLEARRPVAVKRPRASAETPMLERLEREGRILERLRDCPHICALVARGRDAEGRPYLVLERLRGESLEALLARETFLPLEVVAPLAEQMLEAIVFAHGLGVVHRDLSPGNVFVEGTTHAARRVKLLDFGVAKTRPAAGETPTAEGTIIGTLPYAAPEQLDGRGMVGPRADVYAFGAIVFHALTGQPPFGDARGRPLIALKLAYAAPTLAEATGEAWPTALDTFLSRTLARAPAKRFASAVATLGAWRRASRGRSPEHRMPDRGGDPTTMTVDPRSPRRGSR